MPRVARTELPASLTFLVAFATPSAPTYTATPEASTTRARGDGRRHKPNEGKTMELDSWEMILAKGVSTLVGIGLGFLLGALYGHRFWAWAKCKATERTDRPFGLPYVRTPRCPRTRPPKPEDTLPDPMLSPCDPGSIPGSRFLLGDVPRPPGRDSKSEAKTP